MFKQCTLKARVKVLLSAWQEGARLDLADVVTTDGHSGNPQGSWAVFTEALLGRNLGGLHSLQDQEAVCYTGMDPQVSAGFSTARALILDGSLEKVATSFS